MALAATQLVASWEQLAAEGGQVGLHDAGMHYALDVLGRTVFGDDVERLFPVLRETVPFLSDYAARRALSAVRVPHSWPTPANRRADHARRRLWGVVDELITNRRVGDAGGVDLLALLLGARDPDSWRAWRMWPSSTRVPPSGHGASCCAGSNPREEAMLGDTASPSVRSRSDSWRPFTDARDRSAARML